MGSFVDAAQRVYGEGATEIRAEHLLAALMNDPLVNPC